MMLTKPDCRLSLAFTTTLMLSSLREGSQRLKACRHIEKLTVTQLCSGSSFIPPWRELARCIAETKNENPPDRGGNVTNQHLSFTFYCYKQRFVFAIGLSTQLKLTK